MPQPVGGWVCYSLISKILVETPSQCGPSLLVRVSGLRSNSDHGFENLGRNGIAKSMWEIKCQIPV
jgi:hypothetical protein